MVEKEAQRKLPEEFFKDFICLLLERKEGREKETGEKHQCVVASHTAPAEDLARNPGMCPDWELNWRPSLALNPLSYTSQGLKSYFLNRRR